MSNGIVLSSSIRSSLLTLQNTAETQTKVQERLATGRKVNSALDNPTNFFTAAGLNRRASDLGGLLDAMANGVKTLEAADSGMKSITKVVETMRAYVQQARQDKSFKGVSYTVDGTAIGTASVKNLSFSGGTAGATPVNVALNTATVNATLTGSGGFAAAGSTVGGSPAAITIQATGLNGGTAVSVGTIVAGDTIATALTKINAALDAATGGDGGITATDNGSGQILLTSTSGNNVTLAGDNATLTALGFAGGNRASTNGVVGAVKSVDTLVTDINTALSGKVRASNDGGKLRIENLSTDDLSVVGATASTVNGGTGGLNTTTVGGNDVRKNLITQFNDLRGQLDKLAADSGFNGVNLLRADKLKVVFNEGGTSVLDIQAKDTAGNVRGISTDPTSLDIGIADSTEFSDDSKLDTRLDKLGDALTVIQTQATAFGSSLATVQIRQEFTKSMINTLQTGADNLTLADTNEEGANLLALNTRQQLSQTALSLAAQASQAVLRLFG
ncbi:MAG TPA: flagellin [Beijerinckiaceae bacterium]|jgi:flagellin-like hook-associated protein FlgL